MDILHEDISTFTNTLVLSVVIYVWIIIENDR